MFNRKRTCRNPDCRKIFDPINPHADCCSKSCNNRLTYLIGLARKLKVPPELIWAFVVIRALLDRRDINKTELELVALGVNFDAFAAPVAMIPGDNECVYRVGNLGLLCVKEGVYKIVQERKAKENPTINKIVFTVPGT